MTHPAHPIEKWYAGKALERLRNFALPALRQAEAQGFWPKGAARTTRAALSKCTVAQKFAYAHERPDSTSRRSKDADVLLAGIKEDPERFSGIGWDICHAMMFGRFEWAPELLARAARLDRGHLSPEQWDVLDTACGWLADFAPVAELVATLDARRPARTVVFGTLSPSVAAHLGEHMDLDVRTIRSPELEVRWEKRIIRGVECEVLVCRIKWPEGCVHGASRFACGSGAGNMQCEACGHAIKDPFNWVPVLVDSRAGLPHSFWVGRDCARKLLGAEVEGEAVYEGRT